VKRLLIALAPAGALLAFSATALAEDQPFKTVVDNLVPKTPGLTIEGAIGGCDLQLQNQTGQDVVLYDTSKPPKPFKFAAQPKPPNAKPAVAVHLPAAGVWPCATLPGVTEDQQWSHAESTVRAWSLTGVVGAVSFKLNARTVYDPALDPSSDWTLYLRYGAGAVAVGGLLIGVPYLFSRRREILGASKKAA
jgi:hypothetical protein